MSMDKGHAPLALSDELEVPGSDPRHRLLRWLPAPVSRGNVSAFPTCFGLVCGHGTASALGAILLRRLRRLAALGVSAAGCSLARSGLLPAAFGLSVPDIVAGCYGRHPCHHANVGSITLPLCGAAFLSSPAQPATPRIDANWLGYQFAGIAQLVEQRPCKAMVAGSIPAAGSNSEEGRRHADNQVHRRRWI